MSGFVEKSSSERKKMEKTSTYRSLNHYDVPITNKSFQDITFNYAKYTVDLQQEQSQNAGGIIHLLPQLRKRQLMARR